MDSLSALCLALNIYFEARGESVLGQRLITETVFNRVKSKRWPNTICEVIYQSKQFSWTNDGNQVITNPELFNEIYNRTIQIQSTSTITCIDHYHSTDIEPTWSINMQPQGIVGRHIFYCGG